MDIIKAHVTDHEILTEITKKSKAYWGYPEEQIDIWSELLTITKSYIETKAVYKLIIDDKTAGYYSYFNDDEPNTITLDNLFILPEFIGKGLGRILMHDFVTRIKNTSAKKVILESEPNVENFYVKFGFAKIGTVKTSIKNRYLPVMELNIK